jgi:hypothetical protein
MAITRWHHDGASGSAGRTPDYVFAANPGVRVGLRRRKIASRKKISAFR